MKLYFWTCSVDNHHNLICNLDSTEGSIYWCSSVQEATDQAAQDMRRQLDNGVSRKGVGDGVVFSLEFEPTEDNIATLLRGINVFPDLSAWTAGSQVGRVYVGDLDISQVKIIPVADMPASAGDGDDEDEDF